MSYGIRYVATCYDGFAPGAPESGKYLVFPFDYVSAENADPITGGTVEQAVKLYFRLVLAEMTLSATVYGSPYSATFNLERAFVLATDEYDKCLELITQAPHVVAGDTYESPLDGRFAYAGGVTIEEVVDETTNIYTYSGALYLFQKRRFLSDYVGPVYTNVPHLRWKKDNSVLAPSVRVEAGISVDADVEFGISITTDPPAANPPGPVADVITGTATVLDGHGIGNPIAIYGTGVDGADFTDLEVTVTPLLWLTYGGKYDASTGELV